MIEEQPQFTSYTFSGPFPGRKDPRTRTKGIMRKRRIQKRQEAEARNASTPEERRARSRISESEIRNPPGSERSDNERLP